VGKQNVAAAIDVLPDDPPAANDKHPVLLLLAGVEEVVPGGSEVGRGLGGDGFSSRQSAGLLPEFAHC
jgi:hypothetical protein